MSGGKLARCFRWPIARSAIDPLVSGRKLLAGSNKSLLADRCSKRPPLTSRSRQAKRALRGGVPAKYMRRDLLLWSFLNSNGVLALKFRACAPLRFFGSDKLAVGRTSPRLRPTARELP